MLVRCAVLAAALGAGACQHAADPIEPDPTAASAVPLVGKPIGPLTELQWLDGEAADFAEHRLTLVRWWTDSCPFCRDSLPDLSAMQRRYARRGLNLVAVYHPKPVRDVAPDEVRRQAQRLGVTGSLAVDPRWTEVQQLMRRGDLTSATSISVLVDQQGIVRWTHAGPRLHRSRNGRHPDAEAAYEELEQRIKELLRG